MNFTKDQIQRELREARGRGTPTKIPQKRVMWAPDPRQTPGDGTAPVVAHFGGGANSTAYLIEMVGAEEPRRLDLVLFSDTGGERPETYEHVGRFSLWLRAHGAPGVTIVRYHTREGVPVALEERCLETRRLPSLAYGFKKCSQRFKRDPQVRFLNNWAPAREAWGEGKRVVALVGYDADEPHRIARQREREEELRALLAEGGSPTGRVFEDHRKFLFAYPLLDLDYGREDCVEVCEAILGYCPPKSSCFFCPAMRPAEILQLRDEHPDLLARALKIESNAESTAGHEPKLGRWRHWGDFLEGKEPRGKGAPEIACECMD